MQRKFITLDQTAIAEKIELYIKDIIQRWSFENVQFSHIKLNSHDFAKSTIFLLESVDDCIQYVENFIASGSDKKAVVLLVSEKIFDEIITPVLPIYLKPFSKIIKKIVLNIMIYNLIDFIVAKYNAGYWNAKNEVANA